MKSITPTPKPSTLFVLMAEFGTGFIRIEDVAKKYFNHEPDTAKKVAAKNEYPFPIIEIKVPKKTNTGEIKQNKRGDFNVSTRVVAIEDLAKWLDNLKEQAKREYDLVK